MTKNVLITGASGLIGSHLTRLLMTNNFRVSHLGRNPKDGLVKAYRWDVEQGYIDPAAFQGVDTVIHLAGAGIADQRWTKKRKKEILDSRTKSTQLLFDYLKQNENEVKSFISASAIGFYGFHNDDNALTETSDAGQDFLAQVTQAWETEIDRISTLQIRTVKIRIGIVLSHEGGALKEMVLPIKFFVGSPLGSGKQFMSWIHIDDLCGIFLKAVVDNKLSGAYNAVAPLPVTNGLFTKEIAKVLRRPLFMPRIPKFVLNAVLGEMSDLVTEGSKVSSKKIQDAGFNFTYPTLDKALENILK